MLPIITMIVSVVFFLTFVALGFSSFDENLNRLYKTLPRDEFIQYFNSQNFTWTITHYDHLEGKLTGSKIGNNQIRKSKPKTFPPVVQDLPENFDSRLKWPQCETIKDIYSQGDCASGWAIAGTSAASDCVCINTNETVRLSAQDTDCNPFTLLSGPCDGGTSMNLVYQWMSEGFVTQRCKPYNVEKLKTSICTHKCVDDKINYYKDKYLGDLLLVELITDDDIKAWLFNKGPLLTHFIVYEDFHAYKSGIYEHKFGEYGVGHGVRVIGYGEENGVKYWLAANSWGKSWGDGGFFKIKRHQKYLEFERNMAVFGYH